MFGRRSFIAISLGINCGALFVTITFALSLLGTIGWITAAVLASIIGTTLFIGGSRWYVQSVSDEGTGLYNRRYLFRRLEVEMRRSVQTGSSLGLVVIDIDNFRRYNTQWGHLAGDAVLQAVANTLRTGLRKGDWVARWGGEEFAAILPSTDKVEALIVAERLRLLVSELRVDIKHDLPAKVTISLGVATSPSDGIVIEDLVNHADQAMYLAKQHKNLVLAYSVEAIT